MKTKIKGDRRSNTRHWGVKGQLEEGMLPIKETEAQSSLRLLDTMSLGSQGRKSSKEMQNVLILGKATTDWILEAKGVLNCF